MNLECNWPLGDSAPQQSSFYVCSYLGEKLDESKVYAEAFSLRSLGMTHWRMGEACLAPTKIFVHI